MPPFRRTLLLLSPLLLVSALTLSGCGVTQNPVASTPTPTPTPTPPPATAPNPFAKVVILGDSSSAGYLNSSLLDTQEVHGWASVLAQQANFPLTLPLIAPPGFPAVSVLVTSGFPPLLEQAPGTTTGRDNPDVSPDNLAVPGFKLADLYNTQPVLPATNPFQQMNNYVLAYPAGTTGTALQQAAAKNPSLIYLWIGENDALGVVSSTDPATMTPPDVFVIQFLQFLVELRTATSAHLIVGNVPDVTEVSDLTQASYLLPIAAQTLNVPASDISLALHLYPGDFVNLQGLEDFEADILAAESGQYPQPLPPTDVLTQANAAAASTIVDEYNIVIAEATANAGGTVVDIHSMIDNLYKNGMTINGYHMTTGYLGGFYSLDGFHPDYTGYALIANQFIQQTNAFLGTNVPLADVGAIAAQDPLFGLAPPALDFLSLMRSPHSPAMLASDKILFGPNATHQ